jgi:hypothetical protein
MRTFNRGARRERREFSTFSLCELGGLGGFCDFFRRPPLSIIKRFDHLVRQAVVQRVHTPVINGRRQLG